MTILFQRRISDVLADFWSNYNTKYAPVWPHFKVDENTVPKLFSSPTIPAPQLAGTKEQDGPVPANAHLS